MMYLITNSLLSIYFRINASYVSLQCYQLYSQLKYLGQMVSTPLKKKASWPLDCVHAGIKAMTTAEFFIWCYKIQVQDYVVSKFSQLLAF